MKHALAVLAAIAAFSIMPAEAGSLADSAVSADVVTQDAMASSDGRTDALVGAVAYVLLLMVMGGAF